MTADGMPYYHNAILGKSSWEKPPALYSRQVHTPSEAFGHALAEVSFVLV